MLDTNFNKQSNIFTLFLNYSCRLFIHMFLLFLFKKLNCIYKAVRRYERKITAG